MQSTKFSGKLSSVSERKNNKINKMNNENMIDRVDTEHAILREQINRLAGKTEDTVLVSCCGCGCEQHISHDEANEWEGTLFGVDAWMCWECE